MCLLPLCRLLCVCWCAWCGRAGVTGLARLAQEVAEQVESVLLPCLPCLASSDFLSCALSTPTTTSPQYAHRRHCCRQVVWVCPAICLACGGRANLLAPLHHRSLSFPPRKTLLDNTPPASTRLPRTPTATTHTHTHPSVSHTPHSKRGVCFSRVWQGARRRLHSTHPPLPLHHHHYTGNYRDNNHNISKGHTNTSNTEDLCRRESVGGSRPWPRP